MLMMLVLSGVGVERLARRSAERWEQACVTSDFPPLDLAPSFPYPLFRMTSYKKHSGEGAPSHDQTDRQAPRPTERRSLRDHHGARAPLHAAAHAGVCKPAWRNHLRTSPALD